MIGLNGAAQLEKIIDGLASPIGIAFDDERLFVVESQGEKVSYFYVDEESPVSYDAVLSLRHPIDITINDGKVFISEFGINLRSHKVLYVSLNNLGLGATKTVIGKDLNSPVGIAYHDEVIFVAEYAGNKISKFDYNLEKPRAGILLTDVSTPTDLTIKGDYIYFAEKTKGMIFRKFIYERSTLYKEIIISKLDHPEGIAINGEYLYFSSTSNNLISRINISGGRTAVVERVAEVNEPGARLAFRNNDLYISQSTEGAIYRLNSYTLAVENSSLKNKVRLHPNPTSGYLEFKNLKNGSEINIFSLQGENMMSFKFSQDEKVDVSSFETGTYLLSIDGKETYRFIKE